MGAAIKKPTSGPPGATMSTTKKRDPKKGDMIEFFRGPYKHWAVYIGDGEVVHVTNDSIKSGEIFGMVMSAVGKKAEVKRERLVSVAGDDKWQINNYLDNEVESRPENLIVKDALARVGEEVSYNLKTNNCEHFATELRYGEPHSQQVEDTKEQITLWSKIVALFGAGGSSVGVGTSVAVNVARRKTVKTDGGSSPVDEPVAVM